jgi:UDP-N-acetylglucosamine:LPS N-acetylglucosamine transferase
MRKILDNDFYALLIATFSSIFLATKDILKFYLADMQVSIITSVFGFIVIMLSLLRLFLKIG